MINSLNCALDESQTQGYLYGYYNEPRVFNYQSSKNSAPATGCDYLLCYTASSLSTKGRIEPKHMLLAVEHASHFK